MVVASPVVVSAAWSSSMQASGLSGCTSASTRCNSASPQGFNRISLKPASSSDWRSSGSSSAVVATAMLSAEYACVSSRSAARICSAPAPGMRQSSSSRSKGSVRARCRAVMPSMQASARAPIEASPSHRNRQLPGSSSATSTRAGAAWAGSEHALARGLFMTKSISFILIWQNGPTCARLQATSCCVAACCWGSAGRCLRGRKCCSRRSRSAFPAPTCKR